MKKNIAKPSQATEQMTQNCESTQLCRQSKPRRNSSLNGIKMKKIKPTHRIMTARSDKINANV